MGQPCHRETLREEVRSPKEWGPEARVRKHGAAVEFTNAIKTTVFEAVVPCPTTAILRHS